MRRSAPALTVWLAVSACSTTYHPEYHPVQNVTYTQNVYEVHPVVSAPAERVAAPRTPPPPLAPAPEPTVAIAPRSAPEAPPPDIDEVLPPSPVKLSAMVANSEWILVLRFPTPVRDVTYTLPDGTPGASPIGSGDASPVVNVGLPFSRAKRPTVLTVRYRPAGSAAPRTTRVRFDPRVEASRWARNALGMAHPWVAFRGPLLYFSTLLSYKFALREIRYGLDDAPLEGRVAYTPSDRPGIASTDEMYRHVPAGTRSVGVQLVFIDGSESGVERFTVEDASIQ